QVAGGGDRAVGDAPLDDVGGRAVLHAAARVHELEFGDDGGARRGELAPEDNQRSASDTRHHGTVKHSLPFKVGPPHCDVSVAGGHAEVVAEHDGLPGNVPPARAGGDIFRSDPALAEAVWREAGSWAMDDCRTLGELCGRPETIELGFQANENPPVHVVYDRSGRRIDAAEFHPSWHSLLDIAAWHGLMGRPWTEQQLGAHAARAARFILL